MDSTGTPATPVQPTIRLVVTRILKSTQEEVMFRDADNLICRLPKAQIIFTERQEFNPRRRIVAFEVADPMA